MRFLLDEEHVELAAALDAMLGKADVPAATRAWQHGDRTAGQEIWRRIADMGVTGLTIDPDHDGAGAGCVAMVVAAEQLGLHAVPGPVAETLAGVPALLAAAGAHDDLPALAGGALATLAAAPLVPLAAHTAVADHVYRLDESGALSRASVGSRCESVDPTRDLAAVVPDEVVGTVADPTAALDAGVLATAAQLVGLADGMLRIAGDYAGARTQFGRQIGSFQAVKHALADVAIAVAMARPLVHGAAVALDGHAPSDVVATREVSAAKVVAADAARLSYRTALQTLGAIGYTAEHDLSLHLLAARALLSAWGTPAEHRRRVVRSLTS